MSERLLAGLLAGLALAGCGNDEPAPAAVRPVLYSEVQAQAEQSLGRFAGIIQARYETTLGFRVGGRIAQRLADVGTEVKAGTRLATLDPTDQQNELRASQGELARSEAQWINAQANARRQQELFDRGVGAKATLEQAQTELKTLAAARDQAASRVQQSSDRLGYSTLSSDYDGVVTAWHAEAGQVVAAGQEVVTLARPDVKEAVFDLPANLADALSPDLRFEVAAQLDPDARTTGTLREIEPQADSATRTRRVRLTLADTPPAFLLGTAVSVTLQQKVAPRSQLPLSALQEVDGKTRVWVIDRQSMTVAPREVTLLARDERSITVDGQLQPGERVVIAGLSELKPGQAVKMDEGVQP
ncbi:MULTISPECIES: efflux RND transporter periplasmic adaptor subunit [Pseudomonas]|uniref:efflux RND transporter periplasmic adaptor subunit n=1 Tax=Pseudomonas TaxID=286 RepID=UPI00257D6762|nr:MULTISPECIES: efflux RND transporter periplasmic adaptor subunit [Pseudomonas]